MLSSMSFITFLVATFLTSISLTAAVDPAVRRKRHVLQVDAVDHNRKVRSASSDSNLWGRHLGANPVSEKGMMMAMNGKMKGKRESKKGKMNSKGESKKGGGMMKGMRPKSCKGDGIFGDLLCDFSMSMPDEPTPTPAPAPFAPTLPPARIPSTPAPNETPVPSPAPVTPTLSPFAVCSGLSRGEAFFQILRQISSPNDLSNPDTDQGFAYAFLVSEDPAAVDPCTYPSVEERYASVVLFSATVGENWTDSSGWLSAESECDWFGIECQDGSVSQVVLGTLLQSECYTIRYDTNSSGSSWVSAYL